MNMKRFYFVGFAVFTAEIMENAISWDVTPFRFSINRRSGGNCHLHLQGLRNNAREEHFFNKPTRCRIPENCNLPAFVLFEYCLKCKALSQCFITFSIGFIV
jgi:hypothetical protein